MASGTYRYVWRGVDKMTIEDGLPPIALPVFLKGPTPDPQIDIEIADTTAKEDLDDVMRALGWEYQINDNSRTTLVAQSIGAGQFTLLFPDGTEFETENGKSYIFKISIIGARADAPGIPLSEYLTVTAHATGGTLTIDDVTVITGSGVSSWFGNLLTFHGQVAGNLGQTINWTATISYTEATGAP